MDIKPVRASKKTNTDHEKLAKSIKADEERLRLEKLSLGRARNVLREEATAQRVYQAELNVTKKLGYGPKVLRLEGAQKYVRDIVATNYWKRRVGGNKELQNIHVLSINEPPIKTELLRQTYTEQYITTMFAVTLKTSDGWIIALNPDKKAAYSQLILIHELAHVAAAPYDHGRKFQGMYIDLIYEFMVRRSNFAPTNYKIWKHLRDEFIRNKLSTFYLNNHACGQKEDTAPQPLKLSIDVILEETKKPAR